MPCSHPQNEDCVFCRIIRGELPSHRVYEDDNFVAFLDIQPVVPGHTLLVSKGHYPTLPDLPEAMGTDLIKGLSRIGTAVMKATGAAGFNCLQNNHPAAGQMVFHVHWHIIPRFEDDGLKHWPQGIAQTPEAMQELAAKLERLLR